MTSFSIPTIRFARVMTISRMKTSMMKISMMKISMMTTSMMRWMRIHPTANGRRYHF